MELKTYGKKIILLRYKKEKKEFNFRYSSRVSFQYYFVCIEINEKLMYQIELGIFLYILGQITESWCGT